jgi:GxxExxY protein
MTSVFSLERQEIYPQMTRISTDTTDKDDRTHAIIGAAIEVHNQLGQGFLEAVSQESLAIELTGRSIPFLKEVDIPIRYKGAPLRCVYRADFLCFQDILVELKALTMIGGVEQAQLINYLKATGLRLGLLLNFGSSRLEVERLRLDPHLCHLWINSSSLDSADCHGKTDLRLRLSGAARRRTLAIGRA